MNVDIADFLAEERDKTPDELQYLVIQFENYWERKLWNQLTNALIEFFADPKSEPQRLEFYNTFISKFADKINQLKLVDLGLKASATFRGVFDPCSFSRIHAHTHLYICGRITTVRQDEGLTTLQIIKNASPSSQT